MSQLRKALLSNSVEFQNIVDDIRSLDIIGLSHADDAFDLGTRWDHVYQLFAMNYGELKTRTANDSLAEVIYKIGLAIRPSDLPHDHELYDCDSSKLYLWGDFITGTQAGSIGMDNVCGTRTKTTITSAMSLPVHKGPTLSRKPEAYGFNGTQLLDLTEMVHTFSFTPDYHNYLDDEYPELDDEHLYQENYDNDPVFGRIEFFWAQHSDATHPRTRANNPVSEDDFGKLLADLLKRKNARQNFFDNFWNVMKREIDAGEHGVLLSEMGGNQGVMSTRPTIYDKGGVHLAANCFKEFGIIPKDVPHAELEIAEFFLNIKPGETKEILEEGETQYELEATTDELGIEVKKQDARVCIKPAKFYIPWKQIKRVYWTKDETLLKSASSHLVKTCSSAAALRRKRRQSVAQDISNEGRRLTKTRLSVYANAQKGSKEDVKDLETGAPGGE